MASFRRPSRTNRRVVGFLAQVYREKIRRWEWLALICSLFLAAVLRLAWTGIVEFKRDEATLSRLALDLAAGEHFTWLGIGSSVGFPNSPLVVYLFSIPYLVSDNPLIATLFVAFLNIIAVALLWKLTRRYFGSEAALIAAIFYAVSPWAAIFSRKIWAQDVLAPFVLLTVATGILGYVDPHPKRWAQVFHLPLLAVTVQLHLGAVTLVPVTLFMLVSGWRKWQRATIIGIILAGLVCIPYLYGLYDADLLSVHALKSSLDKGDQDSTADSLRSISPQAIEYAWFVIAGTDIHSLAGERYFQDYLDSVPPAYPLFQLLPISVLLGALFLVFQAIRRRSRLLISLLLWLLMPVLAFVYTWAAPQPHYAIPMMPAAFMILGIGGATIIRWLTQNARLGLYFLGGLSVTIIALQVYLFGALLNFLDTHNTSGAFGTPLHYLLNAQNAIYEKPPQRLILASDGASPLYDNEPAVWDILLDRVPNLSFLQADYLWLLPAQEATLLVTPNTLEAWQARLISSPDAQFPLRPTEGAYRLWDNSDVKLAEKRLNLEANFANGVQLSEVWREDEALYLLWHLPAPQADRLYTVFVHGLDAQNERITQLDKHLWSEAYWQAGDRLLFRADIALENVETLRIGLYQLLGENKYQPSELLDAQGSYLDQWASLALADIPIN